VKRIHKLQGSLRNLFRLDRETFERLKAKDHFRGASVLASYSGDALLSASIFHAKTNTHSIDFGGKVLLLNRKLKSTIN